ncbi:alpha/beta hydrolase [Photobacterium sanguinicancri]|uniref:PGAP1-like alpha/beta domain-containing protein n=1 Tax=Photobacterium sanguinicancri TaxID=875932 RepID=UPI003D0977BA
MFSKDNFSKKFQGLMNEVNERLKQNTELAQSTIKQFVENGGSSYPAAAVMATLNGLFGDTLLEKKHRFAQRMSIRDQKQDLVLEKSQLVRQLPDAQSRIILCVHGWCMSDVQWTRKGVDHGRQFEKFGYTPLYLRYNTGRHISENGEDFSYFLEQLISEWPCEVKELVLLGHSMGGLVSRSACYYASQHQHTWLKSLTTLVTLGSPHNGAPLAKLACWLDAQIEDTPSLKVFSSIADVRSNGSRDLSRGVIFHEAWRDGQQGVFPHIHLPLHVNFFAAASCLGHDIEDEKNRLLGDGLVPVSSALGEARGYITRLDFPLDNLWVAGGISHLGLLNHPQVLHQVQSWVLVNSPD